MKTSDDLMLTFWARDAPGKWHTCCDQVTDNFRVISSEDLSWRERGIFWEAALRENEP
jgi:hypothetical protein